MVVGLQRIQYSRESLLQIGKELVTNSLLSTKPLRLPLDTYKRLQEYDLLNRKKTHRGKRSGRIKVDKYNKKLLIGLLNCQSVRNKADTINDFITEHNLDILFLTETWLRSGNVDHAEISDLVPNGYSFQHIPRKTKHRGGGVGIIFKSELSIKIIKSSFLPTSFELLDCLITIHSCTIRSSLIYRVPPSQKNKIPQNQFLIEFSTYLESLSVTGSKLLILGDFNIPWDKLDDSERQQFHDLLVTCNLQQHINFVTHLGGRTLDYIISRSDDNLISHITQSDIIADHTAILARLKLTKPQTKRQVLNIRKLKAIDKDDFKADLSAKLSSIRINADTPCENIKNYNECVQTVLNSHAPLLTKLVTIRPKNPWITEDILQCKREKRQAERKWLATKLEIYKDIFRAARNKYNFEIQQSKSKYYISQIEDCEADQKKLFQVLNSLLHQKAKPTLPSYNSAVTLAESFSAFFISKIAKIRDKIDSDSATQDPLQIHQIRATEPLSVLHEASGDELLKIISKSKSTSCELDPIPTPLLKECIAVLLPVLLDIINSSLSSGVFPSSMKHALVRPLLKKSTLEPELFQNYRPVSNLSFLSKVLEKVVSSRLLTHMANQHLHEPLQSAYKSYHSTETALVRVQNDILRSLDRKNGTVLVLLDLSAAFDTIDHNTLFDLLEHRLCITGSALHWFKSYLTDRTQSVTIDGVSSRPVVLKYGVPQGSVLGPLLFTIYTLPLGDLLRQHGIAYHLYADDTQLYLTFNARDTDDYHCCISSLQNCVKAVKTWMTDSKLKLNDDKTELIVITSPYYHKRLESAVFTIDDAVIVPSSAARNIGVIFDNTMSMSCQVSAVCKSVHFHLRNISKIRKQITNEACEKLIHALITSRIDCGNACIFGIADYQLNRLQMLLHISARILLRPDHSCSITSILEDLHWLPVKHRVVFKILLLTFKALNGLAPRYLSELLHPHITEKNLRSINQLEQPRTNSNYGDRAFSVAAPALWNRLPLSIRLHKTVPAFKNAIKTWLFKDAY